MEWNTKWDWDNVVAFGSKAIGSPKKLHLADWMIVDGGEIQCGSFNLSSGGGNSGASASDGANGSSAKSSISASTDSSTKDGVQTPSLSFTTYEGSSRKKIESKGMEVSETHMFPDAPVGSAEALLGLKLGKRTYFENSNGGTAKSTTFHTPATTTLTKTKSSAPNAPVCCQVEGCNIDLTLAKEYHRKHRVCDGHSKSPKVIVGGRERRFCQQCSRFHGLSEFDEKKRSCRRRLLDHNARRRKPQQETIRFDSTRLSTPIYGGNQPMSFLLSNSQPGRDSACNSKFTLTQGYPLKSNGDGVTDKQLHMPGHKVQNAVDGLLARNNSTSLVSDPDAAPEYRRALSLLSSNSWGICDPESTPLHHQMEENHSRVMQPMCHATPEGVPLSSSQFWLSGQHSTHPHVPSLATSNNFQEIQLFKSLYDPDFYSNIY